VQQVAPAIAQLRPAAFGQHPLLLCRARTRTIALNWYFLRLSGCSPVLADQAVDDLPVRDPGGHIDRLAGLAQRRSLFPRLVRPVLVVAAPRGAVLYRPRSGQGREEMSLDLMPNPAPKG
jgi:hypothetical protein